MKSEKLQCLLRKRQRYIKIIQTKHLVGGHQMKKIIRIMAMLLLVFGLFSTEVMAASDDWTSLEKQYLTQTADRIEDVMVDISTYVLTVKSGISNGSSVGTAMASTAYNNVQADVSKLVGYLNNLDSYVTENKDMMYADKDGVYYLKQTYENLGTYALQLASYSLSSLSTPAVLEQYGNASNELLFYSMVLSSIAEKGVVVSGSSETGGSTDNGGSVLEGGNGESVSKAIILQDGEWHTKVWTNENYAANCYNRIEVSERGYITFNVSKLNSSDYYIFMLYDAEGNVAWTASTMSIKNIFGDYYEYRIGLDKGTYYMNIDPSYYVKPSSQVTTEYKYTFTPNAYWEIENNNDLSKATEMFLNQEYRGVYGDEYSKNGFKDYFKFNLTKGRTYKFSIYNYNELKAGTTIMELFDPSSNKIRLNERDGKDSGNTKYWTFTAEETGWYSFVLRNEFNEEGIEYGLTVEPEKVKIADCKITLSATAYTYNGKMKKPTVTVKDSAGNKLKENADYTVTYNNSAKNVGSYKVIVTMKGDYTGSKQLTFKINPVNTKLSKVTAGKKSFKVTIAKKTTQVTGYEIQYATNKKFTKAKKQVISKNKTTKATVKKLNAKKTYYVRVRTYKTVGKAKYYSSWSAVKSVKTK